MVKGLIKKKISKKQIPLADFKQVVCQRNSFFYVFFLADPTKVNANFIKLSNNLDDKDTTILIKNNRKIKKTALYQQFRPNNRTCIPKPKWFGIFTTHKPAKDKEFGGLTPPKPLRHEYILSLPFQVSGQAETYSHIGIIGFCRIARCNGSPFG